ncbi:uncharacterized protein [Coffea arabica]|uniref:Uncharacterized protein isoform X3 n=1 Tax=Coffea arabica TaxID=13443 RepID=A0A6P6VC46_COFAR|nr:uncharacterized protein LOC113719489 isoform X4 [Coffea arabica]
MAEKLMTAKTEEKAKELEEEAMKVELKTKEELKPWEQHSAVITIPRFDYNAPSSLLSHSHSGFLITCPIKREKSATKEAMSILEKYVRSLSILNAEGSESLDVNMSAKKRRISVSTEEELGNSLERKDAADDFGEPVKLTRSGLLLFIFPKGEHPAIVDIVQNIIQLRESGSLKSAQWCHRIFPIQATCRLDEKEVHSIVSKLVNQYLKDEKNKVTQPVKFAVGYNRRGIEETEMKDVRVTSNGSKISALLDRGKCFSIVAAAVKDAVPDSIVDLKCPELAVLLEVLPLSGIPNESVVVGVSVLPQMLFSSKPRLCVKALVKGC